MSSISPLDSALAVLHDPSFAPVLFALAAAVIAIAGARLARVADELAIRTGLGEAMFGAVLIGAATSLPGIVTSLVSAARGRIGLSIGNALGGIAAQTTFLAIADVVHRRANLEHAAASVANLVQGTLLIALLALVLVAASLPPLAPLGVSPATPVLIVAYLGGLHLLRVVGARPMWRPRATADTQREEAERPDPTAGGTPGLWLRFVPLAALLGVMGFVVAHTGMVLVELTGLSQTAVGALFTAVATSLPELVIAIAAVRLGALNLAVGDILGGNCFDVLFLAGADLVHREGSIYGRFGPDDRFLAAATVLMTTVLLLGLLRRERHGFAGIGFESTLVLAIHALIVTVMAT